jgi:1,4-alpha-glucan branching enzyme
MAGSIQFQLFAPRLSEVKLIGSFNDWQELPMQKGEDGYFRTQVDLQDGVYQYKFRLQSLTEPAGRWTDVNDPYVTEIDHSSQNGVVRVKGSERIIDTYVWQHDDRALPANRQLVIYEMHVSDFCGKGTDIHEPNKFQLAIAKLDYLQELGINAIELLPITEYAGDYRWGYLVRYFFAPESSYGTPQDFKQFVDECHARGIRVLMDGIYNHSDEASPLVQIDRDYWYYHGMHYPNDPNNYWGPEFNYENYDAQLDIKPAWQLIGDVVRFWVQEYHLDGIRYDAVRQLNNYDFLHWICQQAVQAAGDKPFYNIAEHIPEAIEITHARGGPMEGCWHESFRIFAIDALCGNFNLDLKESLDPRQQGYRTSTNVINYLASHDREHPLNELGMRGIFGEAAFRQAKLGAVLLMTAMGVPMIWMGDEFGEYHPKTETTTQRNPLQWQLLDQSLNQDLHEHYRRLIQLRLQTPALTTDNIAFFHENPDAKVLGYGRWDEGGSQVAIVANCSEQHWESYKICNFPNHTTWREWITGKEIQSNHNCLTIDLPAYTARILVAE